MGVDGGDEQMQGPTGREERIFVSVRLRPLNEREIARRDVSDWECISDNTIIYRNSLSVSERSMYPTAYTFGKGLDFSLSNCFSQSTLTFGKISLEKSLNFGK